MLSSGAKVWRDPFLRQELFKWNRPRYLRFSAKVAAALNYIEFFKYSFQVDDMRGGVKNTVRHNHLELYEYLKQNRVFSLLEKNALLSEAVYCNHIQYFEDFFQDASEYETEDIKHLLVQAISSITPHIIGFIGKQCSHETLKDIFLDCKTPDVRLFALQHAPLDLTFLVFRLYKPYISGDEFCIYYRATMSGHYRGAKELYMEKLFFKEKEFQEQQGVFEQNLGAKSCTMCPQDFCLRTLILQKFGYII